MTKQADWAVPLFPGWTIKPNPESNGLILCVERTLRPHTQIVSDYMAVPAMMEDVVDHLSERPNDDKTHRAVYEGVARKMEDLAEAMFTEMGWFQAIETVGLTVHHNMLRSIARGIESKWRDRQGQ